MFEFYCIRFPPCIPFSFFTKDIRASYFYRIRICCSDETIIETCVCHGGFRSFLRSLCRKDVLFPFCNVFSGSVGCNLYVEDCFDLDF